MHESNNEYSHIGIIVLCIDKQAVRLESIYCL